MFKVPGLKIIRVYNDRKEQAEFSIPNKRHTLKQSTDDRTGVPEKLKNISLHRITRKYPCPYADVLEMYENKFEDNRKENKEKNKRTRGLLPKPKCWKFNTNDNQTFNYLLFSSPWIFCFKFTEHQLWTHTFSNLPSNRPQQLFLSLSQPTRNMPKV